MPRKLRTMLGSNWHVVLLILALSKYAHCVEENNLFHKNEFSKGKASEDEFHRGIDKSNVALSMPRNTLEGVDQTLDVHIIDKMQDDNLAVESGSDPVIVTTPESFTISTVETSTIDATEEPSTTTHAATLCLCDPPCEQLNSSKSSVFGEQRCPNDRTVTRKDCPCCKICPKQENETCGSSPNDVCDEEFGFTCSKENLCVPEVSCTEDADCRDEHHCLWKACVDPCPLLRPCSIPAPLDQDELSISSPSAPRGGICVVKNHRPLCECPPGTTLEGDQCVGGTAGDKALVTETTHDKLSSTGTVVSKTDSKAMRLQVVSMTHNSSVLRLPTTAGGELFYKPKSTKAGGKGRVEAPPTDEAATGDSAYLLTVANLKPSTSYSLNWLGKDGTVGQGEVFTKNGCVQGSLSYGQGEYFTVGCHSKCLCLADGQTDCTPRCVDSQVKELAKPPIKTGCTQIPDAQDPECCVNYKCDGDTGQDGEIAFFSSSDAPKLIIMSTTHNSVTLAWDDFRSGIQDAEYTALYRPKTELGEPVTEWLKETVQKSMGPPTVTIDGLDPDTTYEVRVSILDEIEDMENTDHTETITVSTKPGCVYMNQSYAEGPFTRGCEEACTCHQGGSVNCTERCTIPYFRRGKFKEDELCSEQPRVSDECCVLVVCQTRGESSATYDPCVNIVCGPNAQCVSDSLLGSDNASMGNSSTSQDNGSTTGNQLLSLTHDVSPLGHCKCVPGFDGNPTDLEVGCASVVPIGDGCHHHNQTYKPGHVFYDKCISRCVCTNTGEIDCQPRCPTLPPVKEGCEEVEDPTDSCCQMHICPNETHVESPVVPTASHDGCVYDNQSYERHESFTDGCSFKCVCLGYGDVSCSPRCSPLKHSASEAAMCQTLPDPLDECCIITICDDHLDVMRENSTDSALPLPKFGDDFTIHNVAEEHENLTHDELHARGIAHSHGEHDSHFHRVMNDSHRLLHEKGIPHTHGPDDEHFHEPLHEMKVVNRHHDAGMDPSHDHDMHNHDHDHTHEHEPERNITFPVDIHGLSHADIHEHGIPHTHDEFGNPVFHEVEEKNMTSGLGVIHGHDELGNPLIIDITGGNSTDIQDHSHDHTHEHDHGDHSHDHAHDHGDHSHDHASDHMDHSHDHASDHMDHSHDHGNHSHGHIQENMDNMTNVNMTEGDEHVRGRSNEAVDNKKFRDSVIFRSGQTPAGHSAQDYELRITQTTGVNETTVEVHVEVTESVVDELLSTADVPLSVSTQQMKSDGLAAEWQTHIIPVRDITISDLTTLSFLLGDLSPGQEYNIKATFKNVSSPTVMTYLQEPLPGAIEEFANATDEITGRTSSSSPRVFSNNCVHNGVAHSIGDHFFDGCEHYCTCDESFEVQCFPIDCPESVGLELVDPACMKWDIDPDFTPSPPQCCPKLMCVQRSDCFYMEQHFRNFEELPRDLTGCSQRCACEFGNVTCLDACYHKPDPDHPPPDLHCFEAEPELVTLPGEDCCLEWQCPDDFAVEDNAITDPTITHLGEDSVSLFFSTPTVYKGLTGDLYVRYTTDLRQPTGSWKEDQVVPHGSLLTLNDWDHIVTGLEPDTEYTMQVGLMISLTNAEVTSPFFTVHTEKSTAPAPSSLDAQLTITDISDVSAKVMWRALSDNELRHIDGVQVKYRDVTKQLMEFSPMLHHSTRQYMLQDLEPSTTYTVDVTFLPINHQDTTIMNTEPRNFTTLDKEADPYEFNLSITLGDVTAHSAQILYSGVAQPEEKYVHIYQLEYLREDDRVHASVYKNPNQVYNFQDLAENALGGGHSDQLVLNQLKPDQTYQAWLVAFLTNGKILKSNVIDVRTLAGSLPQPERSEQETAGRASSNYYTALVAVAIIAAIACLAFMALLFILFRRQSHAQASAQINVRDGGSKTVAAAAYDNPSYKTYDMEMNGTKSSNGSQAAEGP